MKFSALLTWIVVVAFTMTTTKAKGNCRFLFDKDSGCDAEDVAEIVKMLNDVLTGQLNKVGTRDLNEKQHQDESLTGLRGAVHGQGERHLDCYSICTANCGTNTGCLGDCRWKCSRRDLQGSTTAANDAAKFGQLIRSNLETFEWDACKPKYFKNMNCTNE